MGTAVEHNSQEIRAAFLEHERGVRIQNYRVACILALIFMPAGVSLDLMVYHDQVPHFLVLRVGCSILLLFLWWFVKTPLGSRHHRILGALLPFLPTLCIALMIYWKDGGNSPYYAGLNLVLLGAALVLRWSLLDSVLAFVQTLALYLAACWFYALRDVGPTDPHTLFNNVYFLFVTGVFVVIGGYFYNRIRYREFALRFELDQNKQLLEENNKKLLELDAVKGRFFANISHELRTPLTLLLAPLETLQNRFGSAFDSETRGLLQTMMANGMRLLKLINDLLDLVRLESGQLRVKREPVSVDEFLHGLVSAARQMADDKRIRLRARVESGLGRVMLDRDKMEKVLLNLQFNALKFTPAGGEVELSAVRDAGRVVFAVRDTGMGISAKNLPHVFDRFWQADDSARRKYQGVGIGLSLVKELVEVQGGEVRVESQLGEGTRFLLSLEYLKAEEGQASEADEREEPLPAATTGGTTSVVSSEEWLSNLYRRAELFPAMTPVQESVRPVEGSGGRGTTGPTVLIADDEPDMLRFLKSQLSGHYRVLEAVDGQQAIEKAAQFLPDIVLLDMMMPEKDGLQACRELRERTSTQAIPVILLTARADEQTKLAALAAGANDFLAKPFSTTELHVRIKNLVESLEYQRKLSKQNGVLETTIEQLKETEIQLVQSEKLASLGRMSAGIIHEINNPLNFAATGLYSLKKKARLLSEEEREDYAEVLKDVEEGIARVKTIVSDLRTFTHHQDDQIDQVDVGEVVESALRFLSHEWKGDVRVERSLTEDLSVWANKNKLIQVMVNLLQNSVDAMRSKTYENGEQPTLWVEGEVVEGESRIRVRDNGPGIGDEHRDKIFDPFYTTKDVGEGMGLGLSICYRIVQEADGRIEVASESGKGCEVSLVFPVKGGDQ